MAYIDQQAAVDAVKEVIGNLDHECKSMMDFYSALWNVTAADVSPVVHGRWESQVVRKPFVQVLYKCSKCGYLVDRVSNYCPNCGAKMDGGENNA